MPEIKQRPTPVPGAGRTGRQVRPTPPPPLCIPPAPRKQTSLAGTLKAKTASQPMAVFPIRPPCQIQTGSPPVPQRHRPTRGFWVIYGVVSSSSFTNAFTTLAVVPLVLISVYRDTAAGITNVSAYWNTVSLSPIRTLISVPSTNIITWQG